MTPLFQLAQLSDIPLLMILMQEFYQVEGTEFDPLIAQTAMEQILLEPALGQVWMMRQDDQPIGYMVLTLGYSLEFGGRDAFVDEIYIRSDWRGQGIGTKALQFMIIVCRSLGVQALHLEVSRNNAAKRLYEKVGFAEREYYLMTKWIE